MTSKSNKIITLLKRHKEWGEFLVKDRIIKPFLCDNSKSIIANIIDFLKKERNNG